MKQKIIDVVNDTAEYTFIGNLNEDTGHYDAEIEIANAQEVAEDVIKAYLWDAWKDFDRHDAKDWPDQGRYLTKINFCHSDGKDEEMIIMQDFDRESGGWSSYYAIQYLDLEAIRPECL